MPSRPLTEAETTLMLSHTKDLMHRCLIILGCRTGFRISELLSLEIKDVLQGSVISNSLMVKRSHMKCKRQSRTVVLHEQAKQALRDYLQSSPYRLQDRLFPMSRFAAHRIIKAAAKKAGLEGRISTHSMRKHFAMKVYEKTNKDVVCVQRALGHASLASTTKYLCVGQDTIDNAILSD